MSRDNQRELLQKQLRALPETGLFWYLLIACSLGFFGSIVGIDKWMSDGTSYEMVFFYRGVFFTVAVGSLARIVYCKSKENEILKELSKLDLQK
jgi:hypothetical protein